MRKMYQYLTFIEYVTNIREPAIEPAKKRVCLNNKTAPGIGKYIEIYYRISKFIKLLTYFPSSIIMNTQNGRANRKYRKISTIISPNNFSRSINNFNSSQPPFNSLSEYN
jgi:hypothetical protein